MYRNKNSLLPVQYYNKLPKECTVDVAIVLEPVIATGKHSGGVIYWRDVSLDDCSIRLAGTIIATIAILKTWGVPKIKVISAVASKPGANSIDTTTVSSDANLSYDPQAFRNSLHSTVTSKSSWRRLTTDSRRCVWAGRRCACLFHFH
jgi:hypothetical protein